MTGFAKNVWVNASYSGGADLFPYGHKVSLRDAVKALRGEDRWSLEVDHVTADGQVFAYGTDPDWTPEDGEDDSMVWVFYLPEGSCVQRIAEALGWFRPLVRY